MENNQDKTTENEKVTVEESTTEQQSSASAEQGASTSAEQEPSANSEQQSSTSEEAPNEALEKSKELGQKALNEAKEATQQAGAAFMTLIKDPLGGQAKALAGFNDKNALAVAIVFIVAFVVMGVISISSSLGSVFAMFSGGGFGRSMEIGFGQQLKIAITLTTLPIFLAGCYYATEKYIADVKDVGINRCLFLASIVFIPMTLLFLVLTILGFFNAYIVSALIIFVFSTTFLLIHSSLVDVFKLSTRQSVLLTPASLFVATLLTGLVGKILG